MNLEDEAESLQEMPENVVKLSEFKSKKFNPRIVFYSSKYRLPFGENLVKEKIAPPRVCTFCGKKEEELYQFEGTDLLYCSSSCYESHKEYHANRKAKKA